MPQWTLCCEPQQRHYRRSDEDETIGIGMRLTQLSASRLSYRLHRTCSLKSTAHKPPQLRRGFDEGCTHAPLGRPEVESKATCLRFGRSSFDFAASLVVPVSTLCSRTPHHMDADVLCAHHRVALVTPVNNVLFSCAGCHDSRRGVLTP
jgi:hypothetical protein